MEDSRLCPNCKGFTLVYKPGYMSNPDSYYCPHCGKSFPVEEVSLSLNPDSMQRFPGKDDNKIESNLSGFMKGKKNQ